MRAPQSVTKYLHLRVSPRFCTNLLDSNTLVTQADEVLPRRWETWDPEWVGDFSPVTQATKWGSSDLNYVSDTSLSNSTILCCLSSSWNIYSPYICSKKIIVICVTNKLCFFTVHAPGTRLSSQEVDHIPFFNHIKKFRLREESYFMCPK